MDLASVDAFAACTWETSPLLASIELGDLPAYVGMDTLLQQVHSLLNHCTYLGDPSLL